MRKATMLFVLAIVGVLWLIGGTAIAAPSPAVSHNVSAEFFELSGAVAARVTVTNTDTTAVSAELTDAYGNRHAFSAIQPGDSGVVVFRTTARVVLGYTVQAVVRSSDGRISARGHGSGAYDLRPAPPAQVLPQQPVNFCYGAGLDVGRCLAQFGLPAGF